jgi:hypothetical protein
VRRPPATMARVHARTPAEVLALAYRAMRSPRASTLGWLLIALPACEAETLSLLSAEAVQPAAAGGAVSSVASGGQPEGGGSGGLGPGDGGAGPRDADHGPGDPDAEPPLPPDGEPLLRECESSAQCDGRRPHCDVARGECVQCLLPSHCGLPATCDPVAKRCAPPCLSDWDCPREWGGHCALDRGVCVQCTSDAQCPASFARYCEPMYGACVGCLADFHCPAQVPVCHPVRYQCVQCADDSRCPLGARCDSREGYCYFGP